MHRFNFSTFSSCSLIWSTVWDVVVVFDKSMNLNDAVLVPFDLLKYVVGLDLRQNLNHCLLESRSCHQRSVVWSRKSFLSDLDFLNWLHSVTDLTMHVVHKVADAVTCSSSGSLSW